MSKIEFRITEERIQTVLKRLNERKDEVGEDTYSEGFLDAIEMLGYGVIFDYDKEEFVEFINGM